MNFLTPVTACYALFGIQLDDKHFVHRRIDHLSRGKILNGSFKVLNIYIHPFGYEPSACHLKNILVSLHGLLALFDLDHIACLHKIRRNVHYLAVYKHMLVSDDLSRLSSRSGKCHPEDDIVNTSRGPYIPDEPPVTQRAELSLSTGLKGMPADSRVTISTKYAYFRGNSVISVKNTDAADSYALTALRSLGLENHEYYAFDIDITDESTLMSIHRLEKNGYIDFMIPVPDALSKAVNNISVYHIEDGVPLFIESGIVADNGILKIKFSADSFSPYMFVDTVNEKIITPQNTPVINSEGSANPNTGVIAAIVIPASAVFCVFLAAKPKINRKRTVRGSKRK